jgi:ADP-ribose pyrophosphatase
MLPYDPRADVLVLIEQFRLPALAASLDPVLVELPAGLCDPGETAEATIRRETREEMALETGRLQRIGQVILSAGGADEVCTLFAGEVVAPAADPDGIAHHAGAAAEHEDIRVRVWPATHAIEAALSLQFPNAITAIGLLWFAQKRDWLRQMWTMP